MSSICFNGSSQSGFFKVKKKHEKDNPLLKLYLPYKIPSVHALCKRGVVGNNGDNNDEETAWYSSDCGDIRSTIRDAIRYYYDGEFFQANELLQEFINESVVAKYFISLILYDGLCGETSHENAVALLKEVVNRDLKKYGYLSYCVQYNMGRAYYEGFGVKQSDDEAEKWWLQAAQDGLPYGCVKAQSILAMFYSRLREDRFDLQKAYNWHKEASVNGSLDSQTALAIMCEYGFGIQKDIEMALKEFKMATKQDHDIITAAKAFFLAGCVFAMGHLALYYYNRKMFINACEVGRKLSRIDNPVQIARRTDCLLFYTRKGIALGCFIFARCLTKGIGHEVGDPTPAQMYSKAAAHDINMTHQMQVLVSQGRL